MRAVSLSAGDSWLTAKSDTSAGDSVTDLIENSTPPLVLISSRVKAASKGGERERREGGQGCIFLQVVLLGV